MAVSIEKVWERRQALYRDVVPDDTAVPKEIDDLAKGIFRGAEGWASVNALAGELPADGGEPVANDAVTQQKGKREASYHVESRLLPMHPYDAAVRMLETSFDRIPQSDDDARNQLHARISWLIDYELKDKGLPEYNDLAMNRTSMGPCSSSFNKQHSLGQKMNSRFTHFSGKKHKGKQNWSGYALVLQLTYLLFYKSRDSKGSFWGEDDFSSFVKEVGQSRKSTEPIFSSSNFYEDIWNCFKCSSATRDAVENAIFLPCASAERLALNKGGNKGSKFYSLSFREPIAIAIELSNLLETLQEGKDQAQNSLQGLFTRFIDSGSYFEGFADRDERKKIVKDDSLMFYTLAALCGTGRFCWAAKELSTAIDDYMGHYFRSWCRKSTCRQINLVSEARRSGFRAILCRERHTGDGFAGLFLMDDASWLGVSGIGDGKWKNPEVNLLISENSANMLRTNGSDVYFGRTGYKVQPSPGYSRFNIGNEGAILEARAFSEATEIANAQVSICDSLRNPRQKIDAFLLSQDFPFVIQVSFPSTGTKMDAPLCQRQPYFAGADVSKRKELIICGELHGENGQTHGLINISSVGNTASRLGFELEISRGDLNIQNISDGGTQLFLLKKLEVGSLLMESRTVQGWCLDCEGTSNEWTCPANPTGIGSEKSPLRFKGVPDFFGILAVRAGGEKGILEDGVSIFLFQRSKNLEKALRDWGNEVEYANAAYRPMQDDNAEQYAFRVLWLRSMPYA